MGQKINPIGFRLGINRTWDSAAGSPTMPSTAVAARRHEDPRVPEKALKQAAVAKIVIERPHKKCRVTIHSARPGMWSSARRARTSRSCAASCRDDQQRSAPEHR
jgi:small subunit ribosomal protein S3